MTVGGLITCGAVGVVIHLLSALALPSFSRKFITFLAKPRADDPGLLSSLLSIEELNPVVDRSFNLAEISDAIRHRDSKHARGKLVITVP